VHQTVRYKNPKGFSQQRPNGFGGHITKDVFKGIVPVLYNLPILCVADPAQTVWIVEGEKDADRLGGLGLLATTSPMGAGKWHRVDSSPLAGRPCVAIGDNDEDGRNHVQAVAADLHGKAASVKILELPGLPEKGDVSDWLDQGGTVEQLVAIAAATPAWSPDTAIAPLPSMNGDGKYHGAPGAAVADDVLEDVSNPVEEVDPVAFHGLLGELVLRTQRETEGNPLFVLLHLLVFFGVAVGRGPHFITGATHHFLSLFVGLVGPTGIGRKGSAADVAIEIWKKVDPEFAKEKIRGGLNSGAGLLYHLRDGTERRGKNGKSECDEGVSDKRHVFLESELSSALMQGHREHDPILCQLRDLFDCRPRVGSYTKDPTTVTGGHIGIVGHCTQADLHVHLGDTDKANGTGNRFIWHYGGRSKSLPEGGDVFDLLDNMLSRELNALKDAIEFGAGVGKICRASSLKARWKLIYDDFGNPRPGKIGAFYARAPVIVMRIASIFAIADRCREVGEAHLNAAMAIWEHSERSLRYIFRADLDRNAEKLLTAISAAAPNGLTATEIRAVFGRHLDSATIKDHLEGLLADRVIERIDSQPTGGRPATRYRRKTL
jgi:hypothetical protein